ncbi:WD40 repeat domain-containing protein [Plantactinospora sp. S1510]|uniref:WD40 repeat domain-containing protein n=1 Tax=Plantactinospora alkalitolerans TaxID=2789879 RepID=A0ABS0H2X1_9ACTN|nr:WD40 repeat domain-containing protein [Plantactinospora alkalitolerans]MBF9132674.1 WD40 repeat domain-containing protein [Plantactinospora alkalitolerans]
MTGGRVWTTAGRSGTRTAGGSGWSWRPGWTWGRDGLRPRSGLARAGPYQPVPAWVTQLVGYPDDRTGRPHALVTSYAGARVVLDLLDGSLVGAVDERAHASTCATVRIAGELMIVSGAGSGYLQVSDLDSGRSRWRRWCGDVRSLGTVTLAGRPHVVLTGGSPTLQVWSLAADGGERVGSLRAGTERVAVLAATGTGDDALVAVGTGTGRISLWRLVADPGDGEGVRGEQLGEYAFEVPGLVNVLRFADWREQRVLLGAAGRLVRVWEVPGGMPLGPAFSAHTGQVNSVVAGRLGDRPVLWSGDDSTVRAWLPESGTQFGEAFRYPYEAAPTCTIAVEITGRPMLVTGDAAGLVWVWDPERPYPFRREVPPGSRGAERPEAVPGPTRLAITEVAGRPVVLAGFAGRAVRALDAVRGGEVEVPLDGVHGVEVEAPLDGVRGVEVEVPLDGVPAAAGAGSSGTVAPVLVVPGHPPSLARIGPDTIEVWDPATGTRIGVPMPCPAGVVGPDGAVGPVASGLVDGRWVLLLTAGEVLFRLDVETGAVTGPLTGHSGPVHAVAIGELAGVPVLLSAAADDTVRLWDARSGRSVRTVLDGHGGAAYAVAAATVDGRGLVFGAGRNGQVRSVDLTDLVRTDPDGSGSGRTDLTDPGPAEEYGEPALPEPAVLMTATGPVRSLAVTRADGIAWLVATDGTVLRWHPLGVVTPPGRTIEFDATVTAIVARPDLLVAAAGDGLIAYLPASV